MRMRWAEHVACMEEMRDAYKVLVGKAEVLKPLERCRYKLEGNIKVEGLYSKGLVVLSPLVLGFV
jgi:hypothetical protein